MAFNWIEFCIELAAEIPSAVEDIKQIATLAKSSKTGAAALALTDANQLAQPVLSGTNAQIASAITGEGTAVIAAVAGTTPTGNSVPN